jgi:hypothetical protein
MGASSWATVTPSGSRRVSVPGIYSSTTKNNRHRILVFPVNLILVSVKLDYGSQGLLPTRHICWAS